jgi:type I restriction-modification system DNA methylase subunit
MPAPEIIQQLVARFEQNRRAYTSGRYNEAELRKEFLDPFFEALGWDMTNWRGFTEAAKDVIVEDPLKTREGTKSLDYCFKIGQTPVFFVEAKKPSVDIENAIPPAYQLRRYAWTAHLPLSILTDFEEFAIYDCRTRPDEHDKAAKGRYKLIRYTEYIERWDEIASLFSKEAVQKGAIEQYAESSAGRRGNAEVDDEFLKDISNWRDVLARNFALRNPKIFGGGGHKATAELNYAVQKTIDRILFLRICEARGIEEFERLRQTAQNAEPGNLYGELGRLFRQADLRYNSGLFHFNPHEKGIKEPADEFTLDLNLDDKALKDLINDLYFPRCPYEFSILPAEILGQVYEQFLGKVIRLTAGGQAKVEEKPEVRKAGGVYYTPRYIVDYIVRQTVGKKVANLTPGRAAGKLRIVDPACGSGSFLINAYQFLLDWYLEQYIKTDPGKWARAKQPVLCPDAHGGWKLTTGERKRILIEHIYGVDIDPQAVEVTKLSLLLKVLEGENARTVGQMALFKERALPDLGHNIQCGNSLIGSDFNSGQMSLLDDETQDRVNPFDWEMAFPEVFGDGGFDVVIGNPPYIRIQAMKEWAPYEVEFYKKKFIAASKGNYDIYVVFVEKGLSLLNLNGRLGFILPHKFFNAQYGEPLRGLIAKGKHLAKVVHFGDQQVFENATTYTCLFFLDKLDHNEFEFEKVTDLKSWQSGTSGVKGTLDTPKTITANWNFIVGTGNELVIKFNKMPMKLEQIAKRIFQGLKTGADPVFILEDRGNGKFFSVALKSEFEIEPFYLRPLYKSGNMKRYSLLNNSRHVIFPYRNGTLITWAEISKSAPKTAEYLKLCKESLAKRENGKWSGNQWYCFSRNQALEIIASPKILTADLNPFANYCYDETGQACFPGGAAGGYGIVLDENMYLYVLGLLNSKAIDYYHKKISSNFRGGWFGYDAKVIRNIPIRTINFSDPEDKGKYDRMVALVECMLAFHKQSPRTPQEKEKLQREIDATDRQIDKLVYELYGLTEDEIKIVEGVN